MLTTDSEHECDGCEQCCAPDCKGCAHCRRKSAFDRYVEGQMKNPRFSAEFALAKAELAEAIKKASVSENKFHKLLFWHRALALFVYASGVGVLNGIGLYVGLTNVHHSFSRLLVALSFHAMAFAWVLWCTAKPKPRNQDGHSDG